MRGRFIAVGAVLVACGLVLLWILASGGRDSVADAVPAAPVSASAGTEPRASPSRPGATDDGASAARAPEQDDGALEVEVVEGSRPVPGAEVRLHGRVAGWRRVGSGFTDATGRVRLASGAGRYLVSVRAPGHAPLLRDVVRPANEVVTSLRIPLEPGHSVWGRTVVAGTNEPLPLVELSFTAQVRSLESWPRADVPEEERVFVHSDARGDFRVDGLAAGLWRLEARAPGYARTFLERLRVPGEGPVSVALRRAGVIEGFVVDARGQPVAGAEVRVGGALVQEVTTGAQGGFSVEVEPGAHPVSARRGEEAGALERPVVTTAGSTVRDVRIRLGPGAGLEGRVVEKDSGAPVEGARVQVAWGGGEEVEEVRSDAEGRFEVRGLAPGSYDARVTAPGFAPAGRQGLTVAAGERFPVELALGRTGGVEGQVRDTSGAPIAQAWVVAYRVWQDADSSLEPVETRTNAEGRYRLDGLAPGRVSLLARGEEAAVGVRQTVDVRAEDGPAHQDFTLERRLGTVEGRVRGARGALAEGAMTVSARAREGTTAGNVDMGHAPVGPEGSFRMGLPPGSYDLMLAVRERFGMEMVRTVTVEEGRTVQVEFTWQETGAPEYRGVVLEPDGTPSPGASISLLPAQGRGMVLAMAATDGDGRFGLTFPASAGATKARGMLVARQGGRSSEPVPAEAGREAVVRLRPGATLRGRVLREGAPVRDFVVTLQLQEGFLAEGSGGPWAFSGERYTLRDVPAEPVRVLVRAADGARGEARVTPGPGAVLEVDIALSPSGTVRGRVLDAATKAPLPESFVLIEGEPPGPDSVPDAEGRFTLRGVREGEHVLIVAGPGWGAVRRTLRVAAGAAVDVGDVLVGEAPAPSAPPP